MPAPVKDEARRQEEAPNPKLRAAVARGRSVVVDGVRHGPGTLVEIDHAEGRRLMAAGFLHNPHAEVLQPTAGPNFHGAVNGVVRLS